MRVTVALWLAAAIALARTHALTIESSGAAAPPEDVVGEHQPLQRVWHITSLEELEKLHVLVPGRVFVDTEAALAALETPAPTTPVPPAVVKETEAPPGAVKVTEAPAKADDNDVDASGSSADDSSDDDSATAVLPTTATDGSSSLEDSSSGSSDSVDAIRIDAATTQLRRRDHDDDTDSDDDESTDKNEGKDSSDDDTKKKHEKPTEAAVAKIVITGNSSALLDLFEVRALHAHRDNGLTLQLKNADATVDGFVLTQIVLTSAHYLRHLNVSVATDVVVGDSVFVENDRDTTVKIASSGTARVLIASRADVVTLGSLRVEVSDRSSVQLQVPALQLTSSLAVNVVDDGVVGVLVNASLTASQIKAAVSGSGQVVVETPALTADSLTAAVYGEGVTSIASSGNVTKEKLTLSGSGSVLVGSIASTRAAVDVYGSGNVIVQVADKLKVSTSFSGSVGYVGERPAHVKTSKWLFWRTDIVHPAPANTVATYAIVMTPSRYPTYVSLVTQLTRHADEPDVTITTSDDRALSFAATVATHLSAVANGPNSFVVFSMVATTLVVVGLAANAVHKRRVRRHYRPLV